MRLLPHWKRKGVALVYALFTTALLMSMSCTVVALAIRHGRDGGVNNYTRTATQAANWGIEAVINYMGRSGSWVDNNPTDAFGYSYNLAYRSNAENLSLGDLCVIRVSKLSTDDMPRFGLAYNTSVKTGDENWRDGDSRLVQFRDVLGTSPFKLQYDDGTIGIVDVVITELRFHSQPSQYSLVSRAQILDPNNRSASTSRDGSMVTPDGYILAAHLVEAQIREQTGADFMHYVQNAKSWDVQGVNLATNTNAQEVIYVAQNSTENGRMCVDGLSTSNPLYDALKNVSGTLQFDTRGGNANLGTFNGEVIMNNTRGSLNVDSSEYNNIFKAGLTDQNPHVGIPTGVKANSTQTYNDLVRNKCADSSVSGTSLDIRIDGTRSSAYTAAQDHSGNTSKVPDVTKSSISGDARPSFAKIVVELNGDCVSVYKENPGYTDSNGNVVRQTICSNKSCDDIKNGLISVTGGNVEVVSKMDSSGNPVPFTGNLSIVSDNNAGREANKAADGSTTDTVYSDVAREYYEENPQLTPPYTEKELGISNSSSKYVWPSIDSSNANEREGNIYLTSDIKYGNTTDGNPPALGIVAKNFVGLNKTAPDNGSVSSSYYDSLEIDAVLMSIDHSVQFDWTNEAGNPNFTQLNSPRDEDHYREFTLNGAIVSQFMDVEGDFNGKGYVTQNFKHDENLRFQLPPFFPRWDKTGLTGTDADLVSWGWLILNYVDRGAINTFD